MKDKQKLISVIIPAYNRPDSLKKFMNSINKQTYKNLELIVADDCSDTPLSDVLSIYPDIIYIRNEKNLGYSQNMINAMKYATGELVHFASDDDEMGDDCFFEKAVEAFEKSSDTDAIFTRLEILSGYKDIISNRPFLSEYTPEGFFDMLKDIRFSFLDYFALSTFVFKKELLKQTAPFITEIPESNSIDISTIIKYIAACRKIAFIDCVGYKWQRFTPNSLGNTRKNDLTYQTLCSVSAAMDIYRHFDGSEKYRETLNAYIEYIFQAILADYYSLNLDEKLNDILPGLNDRPVYIYCKGWVGLRTESFLAKNGIRIKAFIEDFKSADKDTMSYETFHAVSEPCTVIIASTKHKDVLSIYKKLTKMNNVNIIDML